MKYKILAKLQKKFSGVPKNLLGLIADNMAKKVTEESEIDDAITALDDLPLPIEAFAKHLQSEGDRRFAEGRKQSKTKKEDDDEGEDDDDGEEGDDEEKSKPGKRSGTGKGKGDKDKGDDPRLAKLESLVTTLAESLTNMQKQGAQKTIAEQIAAKAKEKGIPAIFLKGRTVESAEEIDTLLEEIETDYEAYKQEQAEQGWSQTSLPAGGGNGQQPKAGKEKVDPDVAAFAKKQAELANSSQQKS